MAAYCGGHVSFSVMVVMLRYLKLFIGWFLTGFCGLLSSMLGWISSLPGLPYPVFLLLVALFSLWFAWHMTREELADEDNGYDA